MAALLTGCDGRARRYCVDEGQNAVDDRNCGSASRGYHWYYARGYGFASAGTHLSGGSTTPPASGYVSRSSGGSGSEGEAGGSVRGGIGGAGEAAAGHGGGGHGGGGGE